MPISYIPNGVDTDLFRSDVPVNRAQYGMAEDQFVVLCPTRMAEQKGVLYLAQAANILVQQEPTINWHFVFLGSDSAVNTDLVYINRIKEIRLFRNSRGATYLSFLAARRISCL